MNTATAVFFTVLLLVAAFVGVGYLYNEARGLSAENEILQTRNQELESTVNSLQETLARLQAAYDQLEQTCQPAGTDTGISLQDALDALPWLMMLVTGGVSGVTSLKARRISLRKDPDTRLILRLTRQQMDEYLRWQRGRN